MSFRRYSKNELGWYRAGYGLIASRLQREIRNAYTDDGTLRSHWKAEVKSYYFLQWRLGLNLYRSGQYEQAISTITALCAVFDESPLLAHKNGISDISPLHQVIAQCAVEQFLQTHEHSHIEVAYRHYQIAVDHLQANLVAMFRLPSLLIEFGRMLEFFGSLEAALEVYSQVLTKFPNFHGYFDALYRTAVVAYHLASSSNNKNIEEERSSTIDKCTDILQFLLEALPANIQASHIIFLYARVLETSTNPSTRFRAASVLKSLHSFCKESRLADAHNNADAKAWLALPETWFLLGMEISSYAEFLISREAYSRYIQLLRKQVKMGRELSSYLTVERCILLAQNCAVMQDITEAIRFAELGLQIDRYHPEIRALLAKWNTSYQDTLTAEIQAVNKIRHIWKDRVWSTGFVVKLRRKMINENEQRLQDNRWDREARTQLSYYARDFYRPHFVYEEQCVLRVQRWFRKVKKEMVWMEVQRHHYGQRAEEVLARLHQNYYHPVPRAEVLVLARNKFIPRRHVLHSVAETIRRENRFFSILYHALRVFCFRRKVNARIQAKETARVMFFIRQVIMVQTIARTFVAKMRYTRVIEQVRRQNAAARTIQVFYRKKKMSFRYVVYLVLYSAYRAKARAMKVLRKKLPGLLSRLRQRRKLGYQTLEKQNRRRQERMRRIDAGAAKVTAAMKIQRFYLRCSFRYRLRCAVQQLKKRTNVLHNPYHRAQIEQALQDRSGYYYRNPGISKNSPEYQWLLSREVLVCDASLTAVDYMLLGGVLRHPQCRIRRLILHQVTLFEQDLDPNAFQAQLGLNLLHHEERLQRVLSVDAGGKGGGGGRDRKADIPKHVLSLSQSTAPPFLGPGISPTSSTSSVSPPSSPSANNTAAASGPGTLPLSNIYRVGSIELADDPSSSAYPPPPLLHPPPSRGQRLPPATSTLAPVASAPPASIPFPNVSNKAIAHSHPSSHSSSSNPSSHASTPWLFQSPSSTPREYYSSKKDQPVLISADERCKLAFFMALTKSLSLSSLVILGGCYHHHVLKHVFSCVQVDNPRIQQVVLEDVNRYREPSASITSSSTVVRPTSHRSSGAGKGNQPLPRHNTSTSLLQEVLTPKGRLSTRSSGENPTSPGPPHSTGSTRISPGGSSNAQSPRFTFGTTELRPGIAQEEISPMRNKGRIPAKITTTALPVANASTVSTSLVLSRSVRLLLLDYFNYSLPGIRVICLHGCKLGDEHIPLIAAGVQVNTSLQALHLSLNLLTDTSFTNIFKALCKNPASRLGLLDLSYNLLQCQDNDMLSLLANYRKEMHKTLHFTDKRDLVLDLSCNQIVKRFDVLAHAVQERILPQLEIVYEREDKSLSNQKEKKGAKKKEKQKESVLPRTAASLLSAAIESREWSREDVDPVLCQRVGKALRGRGRGGTSQSTTTAQSLPSPSQREATPLLSTTTPLPPSEDSAAPVRIGSGSRQQRRRQRRELDSWSQSVSL